MNSSLCRRSASKDGLLRISRFMDSSALHLIIVTSILEFFLNSLTYEQGLLRRYGYVVVIEKRMQVSSKQETIGDSVISILSNWKDVRRFESRKGLLFKYSTLPIVRRNFMATRNAPWPSRGPYVEERLERMRRLRITASLAATLRAEYGEEARRRRQRAGRRARVDKMLSPIPAALVGPEKLPAAAFEQATIDALLAP